YLRLGKQTYTLKLFDPHRSLIVPIFAQSVVSSVEHATISPEYDEEREMEPRPERVRETTPVLQTGSSRARRQRGRVVEFEDAPNRDRSRVER
ncbi:hypothetical protein Tco_0954656, partial [Tanacetum coccineum]